MTDGITDNEFISYYKMNYQALFSDSLNEVDLNDLAHKALNNKLSEQQSFDERLQRYLDGFQKNPNFKISPLIHGWNPSKINDLVTEHNGLLIALFHFGSHRHALLDLLAMGTDVVLPIAGQAYKNIHQLISSIPQKYTDKISLLEVEQNEVGRELLRNLKQGKIGCIYVDGNMGPTDIAKEEGSQEVDFFHYKIAVKAGISRLAALMKLPILPVFCHSQPEAKVDLGQVILPSEFPKHLPRQERQKIILQKLYRELEIRVKKAPSQWEYTLCLHRWIIQGRNISSHDQVSEHSNLESLRENDCLQINSSHVSVIEKNNNLYWINTQSAMGFKIPESYRQLFQTFFEQKSMLWQDFQATFDGQSDDSSTLLKQLLNRQLIVVNKLT